MRNRLFIYKDEGTHDRDCVKYIDENVGKFELGHYFSNLNLVGSCFSSSLDLDKIDFNNVTTVLSKDDFIKLDDFQKEISNLGYSIEKGDERYNKGIELVESIRPIIQKLQSKENEELFKKVVEDEIKVLKQDYNLSDNDIELIFDEYPFEYRDRSIVCMVYEDTEELGDEFAFSTGFIEEGNYMSRFFDFEALGQSLLDEGDDYLELEDGRIVYCML